MSDRHRALPSWMAKKGEKAKDNEPLKRTRKRKAARSAFYCMNEKELVEAAVSCLHRAACEDVALLTGRKVEAEAADSAARSKESPAPSNTRAFLVTEALEEESSDCGGDPETVYVSETDLDVTELETVPYTESPRRQGPVGQRSGPAQDHSGLASVGMPGAEKNEERAQIPADATEEDDALRLVREIFFT